MAADVWTPARSRGVGTRLRFSRRTRSLRSPSQGPYGLLADGRGVCASLPGPRCRTPQAAAWTPPTSSSPRAGPAGAAGRTVWGPGRLVHGGFGETDYDVLLHHDAVLLTVIVNIIVAV